MTEGEMVRVADVRHLPATAQEIKAQVNVIQEVLAAVMIKNVHYGVIPGTKKPTLYKAGAEKILMTFRLSAEPIIEDLSGPDEIRYRILMRIVHIPTGDVLGMGVGECSSNEEKYKWKRAVCKEEFEATAEDRRRIKYKKYQGKVETVQQIRTEHADQANTILKMAKKRSLTDGCLTSTAASDVFDQDLEDLSGGGPDRSVQQPQRTSSGTTSHPQSSGQQSKKTGSGKVISEKQVGLLYATYKENGWPDEKVKEYISVAHGYEHSRDIKMDDFDAILHYIRTRTPDGKLKDGADKEGESVPF